MNIETPQITAVSTPKLIGKIPVRNLWLLLLYASDLYRQLDTAAKSDVENNPEKISDLVAEILCHQVEKRLMRNLSFGYRIKHADISRVRGRIDLLRTEAHQLLNRGKIACQYEELTVNTPRNRYVRAALEKIAGMVKSKQLAVWCKSLALNFDRVGVARGVPSAYKPHNDHLGRNDIGDQKMLAAAELAFSLALPVEMSGGYMLPLIDKNKKWLRKLFEKSVAGFYEVVLDKKTWKVHPGMFIFWQTSYKSSRIDETLPNMKTDIVLVNKCTGKRIIIDTKFNSVLTKGWYREETLRNGYLYQIYAYLRTQEKVDDPASLDSIGMLLHPSVGGDFRESVTIQGHEIRFCTVDLSLDATQIRKQLLEVIDVSVEEL